MADLFQEAGCKLILSDIDEKNLEAAAKELAAKGPRPLIYKVDIGKQKAVEEMTADIVEKLGGLDILINNAGIGHNGEMLETPIATWKKLMDVNFWGALYHTYAFLPHMIRQGGGHIVNVSSGQAFFRLPTWGPYATIKLALGAFSELLRFEMRKFNIKVTTVYPFMIHTGFYKDIEGDTLGAKLSMKLLPLYSMKPKTVAKIVFKAVKKQKAVEMVSVINNMGVVMRSIGPVSGIASRMVLTFLGKDCETLLDENGLR
jgi:short-subunit dehydrogenase